MHPLVFHRTIFVVLGVAFAAVYIGCALTPSSYACALNGLGASGYPGLIFGQCQIWRTDEFSVFTPYFQISVLSHFGPVDLVSLYHERLLSFFALPTLDWGLAFKPELWAFHVLPPAFAYSVFWLLCMVGCVTGLIVLLRLLGVSNSIAWVGSLAIFLSQFTQGWWTAAAVLFAMIPWVGVALVANLNPIWRYLLLTSALLVLLFGSLYPPFIISGGFAMAILALAYRPTRWRDWKQVLSVVLASATAAALAAVYYRDLIGLMSSTIYPGSRLSSGGEASIWQVLGIFLPYLPSSAVSFFRSGAPAFPGSNPIEMGAIGSWLPLSILIFGDWRSALNTPVSKWVLAVTGAALLLMLVWSIFGLPAPLAKILLWDRVPGTRMTYGLGLVATISSVVVLSRIGLNLHWKRVLAFAGVVVAAWVGSVLLSQYAASAYRSLGKAFAVDIADLLILPILLIVMFGARSWPWLKARPQLVIGFASVTTSLVTFGTFNPLQSAHTIFEPVASPTIDALRKAVAENPGKPVALEGRYGAELVGLGLPTVNHVLLFPQLDFFRKWYPTLPDEQFQNLFNRYEHVAVDGKATEPSLMFADAVSLPGTGFTVVENPAATK